MFLGRKFVVLSILNLVLVYSWKAQPVRINGAFNYFKSRILSPLILVTFLESNFVGESIAIPLGEHSGCAYPACTSKVEILQSTAPGLVPVDVKQSQYQILTYTKDSLQNFPVYADNKDYESIRQALRTQPAVSLRLTARKVRNYFEGEQLKQYMHSYENMIEKVDYVDLLALRRTRGDSSDAELKEAIKSAIVTYTTFLESLPSISVPASAPIS